MDKQTDRKSFSEIINSDKIVLVDFSAEWCGPCKMMAPILKELKAIAGDSVTILKVDIDKSPEAAASYNIQSVPTLIIFRKGAIKWRQSGVVQARQLKAALDLATNGS
jgi:thioredoxin 1